MVIWITGRKNSGKTTTADRLASIIPGPVIIDGDAVRIEENNQDFSDDGRRQNILSIAYRAARAEARGDIPIVACVSPKKEWRMAARRMFRESILIYRPGGTLWAGTTYEEPDAEELSL